MARGLLALLAIAFLQNGVESANILAVFSSLSYPDHLIFQGYVELLAKRQHHVVVMSPYPGNFQYPDIEYITELDVHAASLPFVEEYHALMTSTADYLSVLPALNELSVRLVTAQIKAQQMHSLLINPNIKFDLVITEADIPLLYAIAEKYQAPHVSITASHGKINMYDSKGNPNHALLYPDVYAVDYGNLTIWGKIKEVERHLRYKYEYYNRYLPACQKVAEKELGLKRDLIEVEYDIDILLVSGTHMLIGNRPTVPAIIYVDRLHIKPGFSLAQDLQLILDVSTHGFVYFSLGTIQQPSKLAPRTIQSLLAMFGELPHTVLWKIDSLAGYTVPDNVIAREWFPQQEVLAHPNIKAFITHGGPRSLEEAIYYEVPIVVVPIVSGSKVFAAQVTKFGGGIVLEADSVSKRELKEAVEGVIANVTYKESMSKLRYLAFDQPMTGGERAVWWTEYVLRHKGAKHLRAPAVGLPLYKYFMLDVLALLLALVIAVTVASYVVVKRLVHRFRRGKGGKWKML